MNFGDIPIEDIRDFLRYYKKRIPKNELDMRKKAFEFLKTLPENKIIPPSISNWLIAYSKRNILPFRSLRYLRNLDNLDASLVASERRLINSPFILTNEDIIQIYFFVHKLNETDERFLAQMKKRKIGTLTFAKTILDYRCSQSLGTKIDDFYTKYKLGFSTFSILFVTELAKNINNVCIPDYVILNMPDYKTITSHNKLHIGFCNFSKYRFIFYPLTLVLPQTLGGAHANGILIDTELKTIEVFEPNGKTSLWVSAVNEYVKTILHRDLINMGYKFISSDTLCPMIGYQARAQLPICEAFVTFFILLRIYNPNLTGFQINQILGGLDKEEIEPLMRNYLCFAYEYGNAKGILKVANLFSDLANFSHTNKIGLPYDTIVSYTDLNYKRLLEIAKSLGIPGY